jgi:hypothetical protein
MQKQQAYKVIIYIMPFGIFHCSKQKGSRHRADFLRRRGKERAVRRGKRRWKTLPMTVGIHASEIQRKWQLS